MNKIAIYCENCGSKLEQAAKFCPVCGKAISNSTRKRSISSKIKSPKTAIPVIIVVVILICGAGILIKNLIEDKKVTPNTQTKTSQATDPQELARQETVKLVEKISKLVELPTGETPTIATVSDAAKLKGQAFFANAQNGDKVLIYTQAKKSYLYRPSTNEIINVAPINIGQNNEGEAESPNQNCEKNYSGCVPIASDVDCIGGSGNGPKYVSGPIQVIGSDVYGLDGDGDGVACE